MRSDPQPQLTAHARPITTAQQAARLHHVADALGLDDVLTVLDMLGYLLGETDKLPTALAARTAA